MKGLNMTAKSNGKSNNQTRGGKRPGAGRPRKDSEDPRERRVQSAVDSLEAALKAYNDGSDEPWTPIQHRWHIAMVLLGVPTDIVTAALFKPQVSKNFSRDIADAIKAVEAGLDA
jgi:hypothetical protein